MKTDPRCWPMGVICPRKEWNGELEADAVVVVLLARGHPTRFGVPWGVLPPEKTIVSLTDESAIVVLVLFRQMKFPSSFNDGENVNAGMVGKV